MNTLHLHIDAERLELALSADVAPTDRVVVPIGSHTLTARELHADPPLAEELTNAIGYVQDLIDDAVRELLPDDPTGASLLGADIVATGASVEVIAAVEIGDGDRARIDGFALTRPAAEDVFRTLATENSIDRAHNPGLPADHVATIVGGCCIVVAIMRRLRSDVFTVHVT